MLSPDALRWFKERRGIEQATLDAFGVESDGPGVTIFPYPGAKKYRKGWDKIEGDPDSRKFWWDPPTLAGQVPFLVPGFEPGAKMILLEGETDTMALWQNAPDEVKPRIVGLSGFNGWKDEYAEELFGDARQVFVILDRDDPYENPLAHGQGEKAWTKINAALGKKARRVVLPQGVNDVAEFFMRYDWAALNVLLRKAAQPVRHYKRLNIFQAVPDTDWVVEDLIEAGVVTVLAGDAGLGKSFISMAMALAVSGDDDEFMGLKVKKHGPVIYVDEENAPTLVIQRLAALGRDAEKHKRLEYLNYAGVNLYSEPGLLLEEALDIEPALVVIDSQGSATVGSEENSNDDMTRVFRNGFRPLARETGAAVVVLHHTPKDGNGAPRGAGAIKAQADQVLSITEAKNKADATTGVLNLFPSKPRRRTKHLQAQIVGDMAEDGYVRVEAATQEEEPW